jgi:hypothetical protein
VLNFTVVDAVPEYGWSGLPPFNVVIFGRGSAIVTDPGPRYFETVSVTGGGVLFIGAFVPLVYCASFTRTVVADRRPLGRMKVRNGARQCRSCAVWRNRLN